jgi:hypothetical protein
MEYIPYLETYLAMPKRKQHNLKNLSSYGKKQKQHNGQGNKENVHFCLLNNATILQELDAAGLV